MGASESTASSSNGTRDDDEEPRQHNNRSGDGGSSVEAAKIIASAAAAGVAVAWGISKLLSDNTDTQQRSIRDHHGTEPQLRYAQNIIPEGDTQRSIMWSPPHRGCFKMNTDGSCYPNNISLDGVKYGPSGHGGILRDHEGKWVQGFIGFVRDVDSLTSELHGILKGLRLLDKLHNRYRSILETDCQAAFEWIIDERNGDPERNKSRIIVDSSDIILECRQLVAKNKIHVKRISNNANKCAHKLAEVQEDEEEYFLLDRKLRIKKHVQKEDKEEEEEEYYAEIKYLPDVLKSLVERDASFINN